MRCDTAMKCCRLRLLRVAEPSTSTSPTGKAISILCSPACRTATTWSIRAHHNRKMPAGAQAVDEADAWPDLGVGGSWCRRAAPAEARQATSPCALPAFRLGNPEADRDARIPTR